MRRIALILVCISALVAAPCALAVEPVVQGYAEEGGSVLSEIAPSGGGDGPAGQATEDRQRADGSSLPFTGLDVGFMLAVGVGLVIAGFGLNHVLRGRAPGAAPALAGASAPRAQSLPAPSVAGNDAARSVALEMMIDGNSREEAVAYLEQVFRVPDAEAIVAGAFQGMQPRRSGMATDVRRQLSRRPG